MLHAICDACGEETHQGSEHERGTLCPRCLRFAEDAEDKLAAAMSGILGRRGYWEEDDRGE